MQTKKSEKGEIRKRITQVQFLLISLQMHRDFPTVRNLCSGHHLCSPPDPLFLHLLTVLGPSRLTWKGHIGSFFSFCLHLRLASGEHQQGIEGKLQSEAGLLRSLATSCKGPTDWLCPSPEVTVATGPFCFQVPYLLSPLPLTA